MATGGADSFNPAMDTFRRYSAQLLTAIDEPEVLAWDLRQSTISDNRVSMSDICKRMRGAYEASRISP